MKRTTLLTPVILPKNKLLYITSPPNKGAPSRETRLLWQKRHPFKNVKSGEPISVTARQLESFMFEHKGRFNSRDYDEFECMELMESLIRDAIHELKIYSLETLAQRFDVRLFGRGKRVLVKLDAEDDKMVLLFSLVYNPPNKSAKAVEIVVNRPS